MSPPPSSAVAGTSPPLRSPGTRGRTSFHLPRHPRRRSSTMTTGTNFSSAFDGEGEGGSGSPGGSVYEEEWEGGDEGDEYVKRYGGGRRGKKDEPMSPLAVVLYVVMFYLIWQLLTRSTESEILAHVAPSSSLAQHLSEAELGALGIRNSPSLGGYNLPYHFPHIPSPIPPSSSSSASGDSAQSVGFFRLALGVIMYPLYLLVTLLAIPFPLLLNVGHVLVAVALTVLYPFTLTAKVTARIFLLTPLGWAGSVFRALSPIFAFVAGVLGFGCIMGLAVGWVGRKGVDWLLGRGMRGTKIRAGMRRKGKRSSGSKKSRSTRYNGDADKDNADSVRSIREEGSEYYAAAGTTETDRHSRRRLGRIPSPIEIDISRHNAANEHSYRRRSADSSESAESVRSNPRTPLYPATEHLYGELEEDAGDIRDRETSPSRRFRVSIPEQGKGMGVSKRDRLERDADGAIIGTRRRGVFASHHGH